MKVKIKGLVFVGFAAAILSANAMAATTDANTVTSKAYTEATYHKKADANYQVSKSDGTWQALGTTLDPTAQGYEANNAVTAGTIVDELDQLTAGLNVNSNLQAEKYVEIEDITNAQNQVIGHKVVLDGTEITSTGTTLDTASDNLVTENVIANAVNTKLNHRLGTASDEGRVLVIDSSGEIVMSPATGDNTYQAKTTSTQKKVVGDPNGAWSTIDSAVKKSGYIDITADTTANDGSILVDIDANQIAGTQAAVTSGTTELTTADGVKGYAVKIAQGSAAANKTLVTDASGNVTVSSIASSPLPAKPTECNDTNPCALVADATGGIHWVPMAQPE